MTDDIEHGDILSLRGERVDPDLLAYGDIVWLAGNLRTIDSVEIVDGRWHIITITEQSFTLAPGATVHRFVTDEGGEWSS